MTPGAEAPGQQNAATPSSPLQAHVEKFLRKVKKVAHEKELKEAQRVTEINVGAANRFISHALPDLSKVQKRQLREVRCCSQLRPLQCYSHVLVRPALRGLDRLCCCDLPVTDIGQHRLPFWLLPSCHLSAASLAPCSCPCM